MKEIVNDRIALIRHELDSVEMISKSTLEKSVIAKDFLIKYDLADADITQFNINGFQTIAWSDPYPDDENLIKGSLDDAHNLILP